MPKIVETYMTITNKKIKNNICYIYDQKRHRFAMDQATHHSVWESLEIGQSYPVTMTRHKFPRFGWNVTFDQSDQQRDVGVGMEIQQCVEVTSLFSKGVPFQKVSMPPPGETLVNSPYTLPPVPPLKYQ